MWRRVELMAYAVKGGAERLRMKEVSSLLAFQAAMNRDVVWAIWRDEELPHPEYRIVKGWDRAFDPTATWSAVLVECETDACDLQEVYGDGEDTLPRDHYPPGALAVPRPPRKRAPSPVPKRARYSFGGSLDPSRRARD